MRGPLVALIAALVAAIVLVTLAVTNHVFSPAVPGTSGSSNATAPTRPATTPRPLELGIVGSGDPEATSRVAALGVHVVRGEFTASTTVDELAPTVDRLAAQGIRLQPLVGWDDGTPAPDLTMVAQWAAAFGPGGSHWQGRSDATAITDIELGNENAFYYKSGVPQDQRYQDLATAYGKRAGDAARAVDAANNRVGILVELDTDTDQSTWIDNTIAAGGPDLVRLMHGAVAHCYGPDWREKLDRDVRFARKKGVTAPFFLTEWGISSDNGRALSDNYGWPVDLTYAQAGDALRTTLSQMERDPDIRQVLLYEIYDERDPGADTSDTSRERYFGIFDSSGADKGGYTAAVQEAARRLG